MDRVNRGLEIRDILSDVLEEGELAIDSVPRSMDRFLVKGDMVDQGHTILHRQSEGIPLISYPERLFTKNRW